MSKTVYTQKTKELLKSLMIDEMKYDFILSFDIDVTVNNVPFEFSNQELKDIHNFIYQKFESSIKDRYKNKSYDKKKMDYSEATHKIRNHYRLLCTKEDRTHDQILQFLVNYYILDLQKIEEIIEPIKEFSFKWGRFIR